MASYITSASYTSNQASSLSGGYSGPALSDVDIRCLEHPEEFR